MQSDYEKGMLDLCDRRATAGDGQFAIAYAILTLAKEHRQLQENLTFGDWADHEHRTQGVFEKLAMAVEDVASAIRDNTA